MKKIFCLVLYCVLLFGITGCKNKKEELKVYQIEEDKTGIIVVTDDKNVNEKTNIIVKEDKNDYSNINENINKYIAYDISLSNNDNTVNIKNKTEVYLKIPDSYDKEKLVVYYILDNEIKETFNVKTVEKNKENYAMFETNHFSIYVLAELKEKITQEVIKENEKETSKEPGKTEDESKDKNKDNNQNNNNTSSNKNLNNNSSNNSSSTNTINLVGNWKSAISNTYYTFKNDYTGILYINDTEVTVKHNFIWSYQDGTLYIKYNDPGMGNIKNKIKVYNENKIDIKPSIELIYNRYFGEIAIKKIIEKDIKLKVNYINIPNGLEIANTNSTEETVHIKTSNESLLNNTYTVSYDLSHCTIGNCIATPKYNVPSDFKLSSTIISKSVSLRNKRYYRDVNFEIVFVNFSDGYYNATASKTNFRAQVYANSETELNNSKYQVYVDMKNHDTPGTWNVLAEYSIIGTANLVKEGLSEYITVTVTEE